MYMTRLETTSLFYQIKTQPVWQCLYLLCIEPDGKLTVDGCLTCRVYVRVGFISLSLAGSSGRAAMSLFTMPTLQ